MASPIFKFRELVNLSIAASRTARRCLWIRKNFSRAILPKSVAAPLVTAARKSLGTAKAGLVDVVRNTQSVFGSQSSNTSLPRSA